MKFNVTKWLEQGKDGEEDFFSYYVTKQHGSETLDESDHGKWTYVGTFRNLPAAEAFIQEYADSYEEKEYNLVGVREYQALNAARNP